MLMSGILLTMASAAAPVPGPSGLVLSEPVPIQPLVHYFRAEDYPEEVIRSGEERSVRFRLSVDTHGRITDCSILSSSGSASLDSATCRVLVERAAFKPARDREGRPVAGSFSGQISWRMAEEADPRISAAVELWARCTFDAVTRLASDPLTGDEAVARSFEACADLEKRAAELLAQPVPLEMPRSSLEPQLRSHFESLRSGSDLQHQGSGLER